MSDIPRIPFGLSDPIVMEAYSRVPEKCRRCPEVLEILASLAFSKSRADLGKIAENHEVFIRNVGARGLEFIASVSEEEDCSGVQNVLPQENGPQATRKFCPTQWLISEARGAVHYGVDAASLFGSFIDMDKPAVGFDVPGGS